MKILPPTNCPACNYTLELVKDQLFCRNTQCSAQSLKKLQHFCKVLKIKGFGEKTLEKLGLTDINDLLTLGDLYEGLGAKTLSNLQDQITSRLSHKIPQSEFIAAMSIPLIGSSVSTKLGAVPIDDITLPLMKELGVGDKAASNFISWRDTTWQNYKEEWSKYIRIETKTDSISPVAEKGVVCITGKLNDFPNRNTAADYLKQHGWTVKSSVTKDVQFLICEDETKKNSSSYKKALNNDLPILTIKELLEDN